MNIERIEKSNRMSQVSIIDNKIYTSGIVADNHDLDIRSQTLQILSKIDSYLAESKSNKNNIIYANIWLADIRDYENMNLVWDKWVSKDHPPCRACVEAKLAFPKLKVEISVIAGLNK